MNFCTKCESLYAKPGTCNCFASAAPVIVPNAPTTTPLIPTPLPMTPYPWVPPISPTITVGGTQRAEDTGTVLRNFAGGNC